MHWRQLAKQLKKQRRTQEKSPRWQRFQILIEIYSPTPTVPCLFIDMLGCTVCKTWLSALDQSAGVGGTAVQWKAEEQWAHTADGGTEKTRRTIRVRVWSPVHCSCSTYSWMSNLIECKWYIYYILSIRLTFSCNFKRKIQRAVIQLQWAAVWDGQSSAAGREWIFKCQNHWGRL